MTSAINAVEAVGLRKDFGTFRAVDGIDLEIRQGEIYGVLGPNGAGKTTALRMLATLLPIDAGQARIFGVDVAAEPHRIRQLIGITGQYASVDEELTAVENLWMFGRLQGLRSADAKATARRLLGQFSLEEAAERPIAQFSGGMRRRLDLAASLITRPPLIFLDEPTTGLDPRTRGEMWDTIRGLVTEGCTVLLTTQYLDEADQLAGRIAVLDRGRKVAEGTPEQLKASVGNSTLQLQLAAGADQEQARQVVLRVAGVEPVLSPESGRMNVPLDDADRAADILIGLRQTGVSIASVSVAQPTLDEVFLALTGHGAESGDDDPGDDDGRGDDRGGPGDSGAPGNSKSIGIGIGSQGKPGTGTATRTGTGIGTGTGTRTATSTTAFAAADSASRPAAADAPAASAVSRPASASASANAPAAIATAVSRPAATAAEATASAPKSATTTARESQ
ncbi:daunorubicin resistance ABC transporter ATPase subunit [Catenulispora acidiphila DSM 44928]|uniref:Daunorubicin resistance ABC transporter ATPase subunit n=1 Tax=Catenulispora acidiphila (strain DSM 44928 / JCM 14897 / NBRC 102108 / NRRL B-24433 / ID139908) TaxID=479433 RepID=C7PZK1_CATAD|nr:ATP-binding cassette domain-containing protein [Catenulispora acidiphila]ACU73516.1 daunorubicin resistance ABC transporter ATPase subunit [Catenulispora acidiphila DSM 44928]